MSPSTKEEPDRKALYPEKENTLTIIRKKYKKWSTPTDPNSIKDHVRQIICNVLHSEVNLKFVLNSIHFRTK